MSQKSNQSEPVARESVDAILAKNLVAARIAAGIAQQGLAQASGISRATIAQLETGYSDPRLSTIAELAAALGIPPILLLIGQPEARALATLAKSSKARQPKIDAAAVARMRRYLATGMLKDRQRAALIGASAGASASSSPLAPILSAILSAIQPGEGSLLGIRLAELISEVASDGTAADGRPATTRIQS